MSQWIGGSVSQWASLVTAPPHDAAAAPKDDENDCHKGTKAQRFIYNKPFSVTLCLCGLVAIFQNGPVPIGQNR